MMCCRRPATATHGSKASRCSRATSRCWCAHTTRPRASSRRWRWPASPRSRPASRACSPPPRRASCRCCCSPCCMAATMAGCAPRWPWCWSARMPRRSTRSTATATRIAPGSCRRSTGATACAAAARWRWLATSAPRRPNACSACWMANAGSATTCSWPSSCRTRNARRWACRAWPTGWRAALPVPMRTTRRSCCGWSPTHAACRS